MMILASEDDLAFLSTWDHWFADGTFRVSPSGYDQLYTILGLIIEAFPAVYALLAAITDAIYERFLQEIIALKPGLLPVSFVFDFKPEAIRTFQHTFPATTVNGSMFHFGQCVWRKLQSQGLVGRYRDEPDFPLRIKSLLELVARRRHSSL